MSLQLNLTKATTSLKLSLQKAGVVTPPALDVAFFMDVSGSFDDEHRDGVTDSLLTRLVPWGLAFDPDKKMDVFTFSNGERSVHEVGSIDETNYFQFVQNRIIDRVPGYNGGTAYSHSIERALKHFGWAGDTVKKAGWLGGLMGKKDEVIKGARKRSLVIIATDGDNNEPGDKERTMRVLRDSQNRGDQVYYLFLGVSNQGSTFPFLEKLGDAFNNTGFVNIKDLHSFVGMSDEDLNAALISNELIEWMKA